MLYRIYDIRYRSMQWKHIVYDIVCIWILAMLHVRNVRYRVHIVYNIVCHVRYRTFTYNIVCWLMISYVNLVIVCWLRHRTSLYDVVCYTYDIVCMFCRHLQITLNFQKTPSQGVCIWPACLLHLAPLFRPCKQCWLLRNTVNFYIKMAIVTHQLDGLRTNELCRPPH